MNRYIQLAKQAVENYVKEGRVIIPPEKLLKKFSGQRAGVFVTIEIDGKLRGCIGTYLPTKENIAEEIIHNAITAATEDYRFGPIKETELPHLSYTVYILGEPELTRDTKELNPKKYGIIVKTAPITRPKGSMASPQVGTDVVFDGRASVKSGLLLPKLEGIKTAEQQILVACRKGGIDSKTEKILIYRFTVKKHG